MHLELCNLLWVCSEAASDCMFTNSPMYITDKVSVGEINNPRHIDQLVMHLALEQQHDVNFYLIVKITSLLDGALQYMC